MPSPCIHYVSLLWLTFNCILHVSNAFSNTSPQHNIHRHKNSDSDTPNSANHVPNTKYTREDFSLRAADPLKTIAADTIPSTSNKKLGTCSLSESVSLSGATESIIDQRVRHYFSRQDYFQTAHHVVETFLSQGQIKQQNLLYLPTSNFTHDEFHGDQGKNHVDGDLFRILYKDDSFNTIESQTAGHCVDVKHRARKGQSFRVKVAYRGRDFCGWQIQPNSELPSVQQTIMDRLDPILNHADSMIPLDIRVCGRTDAGVSAVGQYCRVRTIRCDVEAEDIQRAINGEGREEIGVPSLWCTKVERVSDKFHPTFDATCRAYIYLLDGPPLLALVQEVSCPTITLDDVVSLMDSMLRMIQGEELDFLAFSFGKVKTENTLCRLSRARARIVETKDGEMKAVGIEIVGDRFLRKMVRILVATAVREVLLVLQEIHHGGDSINISECSSGRLLSLVLEKNRSKTAKAAASDGLIFVGARFRFEQ